jgi:hypothetical protein
MKNLKIYFLLLLAILPYLAQATTTSEVKVPEVIMTKLNSMFPQAEHVDWKKEVDEYQADFVYHDKCISILFKKDGEIIYQREEITKNELPAAVLQQLNTTYLDKGYKLSYVMTRWAKNDYNHEKIYEIEVIKGRLLYIYRINSAGQQLAKFKMDKLDMSSSPIVP